MNTRHVGGWTAGSRLRDLMHDLLFPTVLFAALGGMTWAVRGCSGYGASAGCIFAGVTLGAAWEKWDASLFPAVLSTTPRRGRPEIGKRPNFQAWKLLSVVRCSCETGVSNGPCGIPWSIGLLSSRALLPDGITFGAARSTRTTSPNPCPARSRNRAITQFTSRRLDGRKPPPRWN